MGPQRGHSRFVSQLTLTRGVDVDGKRRTRDKNADENQPPAASVMPPYIDEAPHERDDNYWESHQPSETTTPWRSCLSVFPRLTLSLSVVDPLC